MTGKWCLTINVTKCMIDFVGEEAMQRLLACKGKDPYR